MTPTHGNDCIDIRTLGAKTGCSPTTPATCRRRAAGQRSPSSTVTRASCLYRGYPIEQLAEHCNFLEVAYLLWHGELPTPPRSRSFEKNIKKHTMVHEQLVKFYQGFRRDAHPMAILVGVVGALSAFYHEAEDFSDLEHQNISFNRIVAKLPTIVAMAYKYHAASRSCIRATISTTRRTSCT
jgi:citrate synthase